MGKAEVLICQQPERLTDFHPEIKRDVALSALIFLHFHTQSCTLCYLIARFQRFKNILGILLFLRPIIAPLFYQSSHEGWG